MTYYNVTLVLSVIFLLIYLWKWNSSLDICLTLFFVLVPIANMGYWALAMSTTVEEAVMANRVTYLGGCFVLLISTFLILNLCNIKIKRTIVIVLLVINMSIYSTVLLIGHSTLFYKSVKLENINGVSYLDKIYGPVHTVFYFVLILFFLFGIGVLLYALQKKTVSYKNVLLLLGLELVDLVAFLGGRKVSDFIDFMPAAYIINQMILLIVVRRLSLYEIKKRVADALEESRILGYIALDSNRNFLGCNEVVYEFFPEIKGLGIDRKIEPENEIFEKIHAWIDALEEEKQAQEIHLKWQDVMVHLTVDYMYVKKRVLGYKFLIFDETKEKEHEMALKESNEKLQAEKKRADQASEAKSRFLANMSHEIRTPINSVLGFDTMILRESKEEEVKRYALNIQSAGHALLSIIDDILDFSKIESGKMEIIPKDYKLSDLLNDIVNVNRSRIEEKGLAFHVKVDEKLPNCLLGDDIRIRQIVTNLLTNAAKYTNEGSVTLSVKGHSEGDAAKLYFSVKDTGIGIKEENIDELFKEFVRIDEKKTRSIAGTGLGLNLVSSFLAMMGSKLEVKSVYGEGSEFSFCLNQPIIEDEPMGDFEERISDLAKQYKYENSYKIPNARLLVVDDNKINRLVFKELLKDLECTIDEAEGGNRCLELVKENHYDIIFMDHMMPEIDGVETFRKMQELGDYINSDTPVIVLTANAIVGSKEYYLAEGFQDYLSKPIMPDELEKMIRKYLPESVAGDLKENVTDNLRDGALQDIVTPDEDSTAEELPKADFPEMDGMYFTLAMDKLKSKDLLTSIIKDFVTIGNSHKELLIKQYYDILSADEETLEDAFKQYRVQVHSMKTSAATVGAIGLSEIAKFLEYAAADQRKNDIEKLTELFLIKWEETVNQLRDAFISNQTLIEVDYMKVEECLQSLEEAVAQTDLDAMDAISENLKQYDFPEEQKVLVDKLVQAIFNIDYDECNNLIEELRKSI